jgi:peptidoglycan/LPS O-acetylase OafA/YrhL
MMKIKTFGQILQQYNGVAPGFDFLRMALALAILFAHLAPIAGTRGIVPSTIDLVAQAVGQNPVFGPMPAKSAPVTAANLGDLRAPAIPNFGADQAGWLRPIVLTHVPMFFALSGFLVAGSAFRTKRVAPFLALRVCRILPALLVEVTLSAILIGVTFTTLPLSEYFTSSRFWSYFGNILGFVQMDLPGVIFHNGHETVNANLWTLPAEFRAYLLLAVFAASSILFSRTIFTIIFAAVTILLLIANIGFGYGVQLGVFEINVSVYYFFVGVLFYLWRDHIPYSIWLVVPGAVASYFLMRWPYGVYIVPGIITYITVFIGMTKFWDSKLLKSGDYSYGIYLYGFPISQITISAFPSLSGNFWGLAIPTVLFTGTFAFLSWHAIEKPFLRLRKLFSVESAQIAETLHPDEHASQAKASRSPAPASPL